jgi:hypothetical protein
MKFSASDPYKGLRYFGFMVGFDYRRLHLPLALCFVKDFMLRKCFIIVCPELIPGFVKARQGGDSISDSYRYSDN